MSQVSRIDEITSQEWALKESSLLKIISIINFDQSFWKHLISSNLLS